MNYIGTSGFNYKHWKNVFYPKDVKQNQWLSFYATCFNSVELNVTFYRLPTENAFIKWYEETPKDFRFAIKGSRFITHTKRLNEVDEPLKRFFERAKNLQDKLGIVLWQFPSNFHLNIDRFDVFLSLLEKYHVKNAFEFRHESWFSNEVFEILKKKNFALVVADSPIFPINWEITADYGYFRFHGGKKLYGSEYSEKELENWAQKINSERVREKFVYFNNDAFGFAVKNAQRMKDLIE